MPDPALRAIIGQPRSDRRCRVSVVSRMHVGDVMLAGDDQTGRGERSSGPRFDFLVSQGQPAR